MNFGSLSLKQAPDISIPLRFFLTAPLFAISAMVLWLMTGPQLLQERWLPQTLAFTHLMTLGFITMIMIGAMFQLLPVITGRGLLAARYTSLLIHGLFTAGVAMLASGFITGHASLMQIAMILLSLAFVIFLPLLTHTLFSVASNNDAVRSMRIAVLSLWIAIGLGIWLLSGHGGYTALSRHDTPLHIAWAAIGWVNVMIISIAYQVIPMFEVTHDYPRIISRWLTPGIFLLLLIWTALHTWLQQTWPGFVLAIFICLLLLVFISITLHLQIQRKKFRADASLYFWVTGITGLFICMLLYLYANVVNTDLDTVIGICFVFGFVVPIINGMLYKIIPFLVWLHLTNKVAFSKPRIRIPNMQEIISNQRCMLQFGLHGLALLITLLYFLLPQWLFYPAVVAWLTNFIVFWFNMVSAVVMYVRVLRTIKI